MMEHKGCKYSLGIDPGNDTGFGIWDGTCELVIDLHTIHHDKASGYLMEVLKGYAPVVVGIEVPKSKRVWDRFPGETDEKKKRKMLKIAQNVGDAYQKAKMWVAFCKGLAIPMGFDVVEIPPGKTKLSREAFEQFTGFPASKQSSTHSRDAVMVARRAYNTWHYDQLVKEAERGEG